MNIVKWDAESKSVKIYQDELIPLNAERSGGVVPLQYRKMRQISSGAGYLSADMLFYRQGRFMEKFEDDFEIPDDLTVLNPTYETMSISQLRGYFSWRTRVRRGELPVAPRAFGLVYIYELINQIGVKSLVDGFNKLKEFYQKYRTVNPQIDRCCRLWLNDYVVYYNLSRELLSDIPNLYSEQDLFILHDPQANQTEAVFNALDKFSPYKLSASKFYQKYPEEITKLTYNVFTALANYYQQKHSSIMNELFGTIHRSGYRMFAAAVFDEPPGRIDSTYEVNCFRQYHCRDRRWSCERFIVDHGKLQKLGALLKNIDFAIRKRYKFKSGLKPKDSPSFIWEIIEQQLDIVAKESVTQATRHIEIDLSQLEAIRLNALEIQNKLIIEEPDPVMLITPIASPKIETVPLETVEETSTHMENNLTASERKLLLLLLSQEDYKSWARSAGLMLSMLADSINEKLFDQFGDTVLSSDNDMLEVIEDYMEDLKGICKI